MRFDALQARVNATDRLLSEARDQVALRNEDVRMLERRLSDTSLERDTLATRIAGLESDMMERESILREGEDSRNALLERASALAKAYNTKEAELSQAHETIHALNERVAFIEQQTSLGKANTDRQIEDLKEALRREKVERAVIEGALDAARKDFTRLMKELMALEQQRAARDLPPELRSANAA
jgi:crescentin